MSLPSCFDICPVRPQSMRAETDRLSAQSLNGALMSSKFSLRTVETWKVGSPIPAVSNIKACTRLSPGDTCHGLDKRRGRYRIDIKNSIGKSSYTLVLGLDIPRRLRHTDLHRKTKTCIYNIYMSQPTTLGEGGNSLTLLLDQWNALLAADASVYALACRRCLLPSIPQTAHVAWPHTLQARQTNDVRALAPGAPDD